MFDAVAPAVIVLPGHDLVQVALEGPHVGVDAHVVVVEDHQEALGLQIARLVQPLEGEAGGHGAVSNDGDAGVVLVLEVAGLRHAEHRGDAGAGVAGTEVVVGALVPLQEAGETVVLAEGGEAPHAAGEDLVRIGLVAHVPDNAVLEKVEVVKQGHGEFHGAQVGAEMAAGLRHGSDQEGADLGRQLLELAGGEMLDLLGGGQRVEQGIGRGAGGFHGEP
jgi:hypothetical protein